MWFPSDTPQSESTYGGSASVVGTSSVNSLPRREVWGRSLARPVIVPIIHLRPIFKFCPKTCIACKQATHPARTTNQHGEQRQRKTGWYPSLEQRQRGGRRQRYVPIRGHGPRTVQLQCKQTEGQKRAGGNAVGAAGNATATIADLTSGRIGLWGCGSPAKKPKKNRLKRRFRPVSIQSTQYAVRSTVA